MVRGLVLALGIICAADQISDFFKEVFPKLLPSNRTGDYILIAQESIRAGEVIAAINVQDCLVSFDAFPLSDKLVEETEDVKIATRFLYERFINEDKTLINFWVKSLPRMSTNSFGWRSEDLEALEKANVFHQDLGSSKEIEGKFKMLNESLSSDPEFPQSILTLDDYKWAYAQMFTRCAGIKKTQWAQSHQYDWFEQESDDEKEEIGVICYPLFDLPGYCTSTLTRITGIQLKNEEKQWYGLLIAERNFTAGQRFCMNFPHMPNSNLMFLKGLVLEKNRFDTALVEFSSSGKVACPGQKKWSATCVFGLEYNGLNKAMLQYIREDRSGGQNRTQIPKAQFYQYFLNLTTQEQQTETPKDFLLSVVEYRNHLVNDLLQKRYSHSIRGLRRDLNMNKILRTFTLSTFMIPYNNLEHVERLLLKMFAVQLLF